MASNDQPIGIFDSGIGGLTVFRAVREALPNESMVYLGDTARVPYGNKSAETVIKYSIQNAQFLISRGVKVIVVACNTSAAHSLSILASKFNVPVIGVIEPGARKAIAQSKNRHVGVIGTLGTIMSNAYATMLKRIDPEVRVVSLACPLFVPLVEEGWLDNDVAETAARRYLSGVASEGVDTLILGCTHYPLLKNVIQKVVGSDVTLIDSGEATADALKTMISEKGLLSERRSSDHQLYVTDVPSRFEITARNFLGGDIPPIKRIEL